MLRRTLKYGLILQAELLSMVAEEIQRRADEFVQKNVDADYETYLSDLFVDLENQFKKFSSPLEQVITQVASFKEQLTDVIPKKM